MRTAARPLSPATTSGKTLFSMPKAAPRSVGGLQGWPWSVETATKAEAALVGLFGPLGFKEQTIVRTGMPRGSGYPQHYKVDCGNAALKIGVEADGGSHDSPERKQQDQKKDNLLTGMGWRVFRFKNDVILTRPDYVFETVLTAILERH